jgi:hypothetical protein
MTRAHRLVIALLIGVSMVAGVYSLTATLKIGAQATASKTPNSTIVARTKQLDAMETKLRKALAQRPPKLPQVPQFNQAGAAAPAFAARPQQVVYVRPKPIVVRVHRSGGERESDHEGADN